jgi:hypothetical protein
VTFRAAPVVITREHSLDTPGLWEVGRVLKIGDLNLVDYDVLVDMAVVDQNVVRFDI